MSAARKTLNVAMIGQGFMGRAHSNAFHQVGHFFDSAFELRRKVICGRNREALDAMAARWGWEETATEWQSVVERKDIDVVDVATPNNLHAPVALAAAKAGKILLCEKPLAMSVAEAEQMAAAARKVPNLVWFNYRRVPAIALAKRLMEEGRLGQVYHYRAVYLQSWGPERAGIWRFKKSEAGSGAMGDLLSHSIDLALMLNGEIGELSAMLKTFAPPPRDVDDAVLLLARFANGSIGSFEATRYAIGRKNYNQFEIHGSKGMLRFNLEDLNRLEFYDCGDKQEILGPHQVLVTGPGHPYVDRYWPPGHIIGYEHTFTSTLADFLESLAKNQPFHANFDDALAVQRVLEAVEHSAGDGHWVRLGKGTTARAD
jgi:predicted dehydrogenase